MKYFLTKKFDAAIAKLKAKLESEETSVSILLPFNQRIARLFHDISDLQCDIACYNKRVFYIYAYLKRLSFFSEIENPESNTSTSIIEGLLEWRLNIMETIDEIKRWAERYLSQGKNKSLLIAFDQLTLEPPEILPQMTIFSDNEIKSIAEQLESNISTTNKKSITAQSGFSSDLPGIQFNTYHEHKLKRRV